MSRERNSEQPPLRSLRLAVLIGLMITVLASALVQFSVARFLLVEHYVEHEREDGSANAERALGYFNRELRRLDQIAKDWSQWDDAYDFVQGKNAAFIQSNIRRDVFTNLKLDLMVYVAADGTPRLARSMSADTGEPLDIPPEVAALFSTSNTGWLVAHRDNRAMLEFVQTARGLLAVTAHPVHRSDVDAPGPSVGTQIFARYLGPEFVQDARDALREEIALFRVGSANLPRDVQRATETLSATNPVSVMPVDDATLGSYALLNAQSGAPLAVVRTTAPRRGYATAVQIQHYLLWATLAIGALAGLAVFWFIERRIMRRLVVLDRAVQQVAADGDPAGRVPEFENADEVARLAHSVNAMLIEIDTQRGLREARDAAVLASRLKSEFLANMSHEIRTPLYGVMGMLELTLEGDPPTVQRERIATAYQSANNLLNLINDSLDYSQLEAGTLALEISEFDLRQIIEEVTLSFAPRAEQQGLALNCVVDPALAPRYRGDGRRLRQIVTNLVGNAIRFTQYGEVAVRAAHGTAADVLEITVTDTGPGLSPEQLAHLFRPFNHGEAATARDTGGSGLGFAICKLLVTRMDGEIEAESTAGKGCRIRISLSLAVATASDPLVGGQSYVDSRVLVLGPDDACREAVLSYLRDWGYEADLLTHASDVATVDASRLYDFVVVDETSSIASDRWLPPTLRALPTIRLVPYGTALDSRDGYQIAKPMTAASLKAALAHLGDDGALPASAVNDSLGLPASDFGGKRLLLVEDIELNRNVTHQLLAGYGVTVDDAESGQQAIALLETRRYDLVLMDLRLPGIDGLEVTRRWRAREQQLARGRVAIVALTAHALSGDAALCYKAGMDDYLTKPLSRRALTVVLTRWLVTEPLTDTGVLRDIVGQHKNYPAGNGRSNG
ncbi:MAG: response regulator [Gammaproteobacteria bacterium]|nr:response regulator [Gammaproteobacteria bacterium]